MALYYITGVAGTGKSTIRQYLQNLGYTAYDADLDGITGWHHKETNTPVYGPDMDGYLTKQWYDSYDWKLVRHRVEQIAEEAQDKPVFLCGTSANDTDIHDLLAGVAWLSIDEGTLRQRLATRDTNSFGKTEDELNHVLQWLKPAEEYYRAFGARMLDAAAPLEHVVEQVLSWAMPASDEVTVA